MKNFDWHYDNAHEWLEVDLDYLMIRGLANKISSFSFYSKSNNKANLEVIDAIDAWDLDFSEGNIIKYLIRAKHKKNTKEDLEKCLWYIQRLLEKG